MPSIAERWVWSNQSGAALLTVVMILAIVSLLGMSALQISVLSEHSARNDRDYQIAWQAAEAALMDAEDDIEGRVEIEFPGSRSDLFNSKNQGSFMQGCGNAGDSRGLCLPNSSGEPIWLQIKLADHSSASFSVPFGTFTGRHFPTGSGLRSAQLPRYVIEAVTDYGATSASPTSNKVYRITAIGFGPRVHTQVVLQTIYRK